MNAVNLESKLTTRFAAASVLRTTTFSEHWQPRTVSQFNGHDIMVVKAKGEFL